MKSPFVIIFLLVSIFTYAQDTEDFDFYYNEGVKNYDIDNYETALEFFVKALEIEPNHVDTNYKIGNTFSFLGIMDSLPHILQLAIIILPRNSMT
jgi:tetratricopeptide (TPR) repeat protein